MSATFNVPVTYTDFKQNFAGSNHTWSTIGQAAGGIGITLRPNILPPGPVSQFYTGLPLNNTTNEGFYNPSIDYQDNLYANKLLTNALTQLGVFDITIGAIPVPVGVRLISEKIDISSQGNMAFAAMGGSGTPIYSTKGGFWMRPIDQPTNYAGTGAPTGAYTLPLNVSHANTYTYRYTAFSDLSFSPSSEAQPDNSGVRGVVFSNASIVFTMGIPVINSATPTNPTTCLGTNGKIALDGLITGVSYIINYSKNSSAQTAITQTAVAGTVTLTGLSAGNYTNITVRIGTGCISNEVSAQLIDVACCPTYTAPPVTSLSIFCPANSVNLNSAHTGTVPVGTTLVWYTNNAHTGTPLSGTQVTNATAGTYYAFYQSSTTANCFGPVSNAVIVSGNGTLDSDGDGIPDICDLDDDNDGISDCIEKGLDDIANTFKINGNAVRTTAAEAILTPDALNQSGQMWSYGKVDFTNSFTLSYEAYFGTKDNGADGIATVLHNSPLGTNAIGANGSGLGARGIANGIVLELDTYSNANDSGAGGLVGDIPADHGMIWDSDNQVGAGLLTPAVALPNLEDGNYHNVVIIWNKAIQNISYTVDGITAGSFTGDLINNYFGGASKVYFGYTASTGGSFNLQKIRIVAPCNDLPLILDTDGDGIPNHLDLDSDNDGCPDAMEGDENVTLKQLVNALGIVTVGTGSPAANQNLGNTVDAQGIPTIVNAGGAADIGGDVGQGRGSSIDATINGCNCTNPPTTGTPDGYTKTGISNLVGFANGWPGNVPNGFIAIESKNKGFVITRVSSSAAITTPIEGMLIYDIAAACVKLYNGTTWKCLQQNCQL